MRRPLDFDYRGDLSGASRQLTRHLGRVALMQGWARRVREEGRTGPWLALLIGYLSGLALLVPLGPSPWLGLLLLHLAYVPLAEVFWRASFGLPRASQDRIHRLQEWSERLRLALPEHSAVDVQARLAHAGCGGGKTCGAPWVDAFVFLPDGGTIEVGVTDGRTCPLLRDAVPHGSTMIELRLLGESAGELARIVQAVARLGDPPGFITRVVEPDGPSRLRWRLEQKRNTTGDTLPVWPLVRLARLRGTRLAPPAEEAIEIEPATAVAMAESNPRYAFGDPLFDTSVQMPLWRRGQPLEASLERAWENLRVTVPCPSITTAATFLVVNGALAAATAAVLTLSGVALGLGTLLSSVWLCAVVCATVFGGFHLVQIPWRLVRRGGTRGRTPTGRVAVDSDGVHVFSGGPSSVRISFATASHVHVTRDPVATDGTLGIHLTLVQRRDGDLVRTGVSTRVPESPEILCLPAKFEHYPELDVAGFALLWETLRDVGDAHGSVVPAPPEFVRSYRASPDPRPLAHTKQLAPVRG